MRQSQRQRQTHTKTTKGKDKHQDKSEPTTQMHGAWLPRQQAQGFMDSANGGIPDPCCSYFQREGNHILLHSGY